MSFNLGKCKCIHIGIGNMDEAYKMRDIILSRTIKEKDWGSSSCHYTFPRHCSKQALPTRLDCKAQLGEGILADVPSFAGPLHSHIQC